MELAEHEIPDLAKELIGTYLRSACLLGQRTGEMHVALASDSKDPAFAPEPFTALISPFALSKHAHLSRPVSGLIAEASEAASRRSSGTRRRSFELSKPRSSTAAVNWSNEKSAACESVAHGDYHLGQVLIYR